MKVKQLLYGKNFPNSWHLSISISNFKAQAVRVSITYRNLFLYTWKGKLKRWL